MKRLLTLAAVVAIEVAIVAYEWLAVKRADDRPDLLPD